MQPLYEKHISFDLYEFMEWLNKARAILFFYNGADTVGTRTGGEILSWYAEHGFDNFDAITDKVDKGYGFFRSWMDFGVSEDTIQDVIRYMVNNRLRDSRDIDEDKLREMCGDDWNDYMVDDPLFIPDIRLDMLRRFNKGLLVGGGFNECLKEVRILMDTFNVRYRVVRQYTY